MNIPYLTNDDIWKKVELFREKYCKCYEFPYDIEFIIDNEFNIGIIPTPGLKNGTGTLASLQNDLKAIRVDASLYKKVINNKFHSICLHRIDLAHEIAHVYLHKHLYQSAKISDYESWVDYIGKISSLDYSKIEYQAKEFAGRLLVPVELLKFELGKHKTIATKLLKSKKVSHDFIIDNIIVGLPWHFKVSELVIYKRVIQEKIIEGWISEQKLPSKFSGKIKKV